MFRNKRTRWFLFVPPMFQLIIFGYAVNLDVDNLRMGWMDMDQSPQSHNLLADFQGSGRFLLTALPQNERQDPGCAGPRRCAGDRAGAAWIWPRYPAGAADRGADP